KAISKQWKPKDCPKGVWPAKCLLLYLIPEVGVAEVIMEIIGAVRITKMDIEGYYFGPKIPDIAFVRVNMKDLPKIKVKYNIKDIRVGKSISTIGFPMGIETLMAPGYLHQIAPTLQKGIISAILPFECPVHIL
ncbi:unnamed protein product, partial [marine sediment metagenome]